MIQFKLLNLILKGGKGSGNFGHKGRKGVRGGSGSGGIVAVGIPEGTQPLNGAADLSQLRPQIEKVAKQLKFDPNKIVYDPKGYTFSLNGQNLGAAATYNPDTGIITLYPGFVESSSLGNKVMGGLLAHEITHNKFKKYEDNLAIERAKVRKKVKLEKKKGVPMDERFLNPDGTIRSEANKKKFPAYNLETNIQKARQTLDPVTKQSELSKRGEEISDYSKQYWQEANSNPAYTERAVNETLAEIGRRKFISKDVIIHPVWESLYQDFLNVK